MITSEIDINGITVKYYKQGKGNPLLLLHGWGLSANNYLQLQEYLAKHFTVFALDLPGFGGSQPPDEPWEVGDYAVFVQEFIEKLKLKKVYLFGHSFGGRVGIKFAVRYPDLLKGLILCNSAGIKPKNTLKKMVFKTIAKSSKLVFSLPVLSKLSPFAKKILYQAAREKDYLKLDNEIMKKTFVKVVSEDLKSFLPFIKTSTLILWGRDDQATPLTHGRLMEQEIENSRIQVFNGIGHKLPYAKPKEVAREIIKFAA